MPARMVATVMAAAIRAGIAYNSLRSTDGICRRRVSRIVPPPHPSHGAQDDRRPDPESEGHRLLCPDDRKHAQPDRVQHVDRHLQSVQALAERERHQPPADGQRQVAPVAEGGRRYVADQDIAEDAPAHRGDYSECDHADDVELSSPDRGQRTVEREHEGAGQIQRQQQQRRLGRHAAVYPRAPPGDPCSVGLPPRAGRPRGRSPFGMRLGRPPLPVPRLELQDTHCTVDGLCRFDHPVVAHLALPIKQTVGRSVPTGQERRPVNRPGQRSRLSCQRRAAAPRTAWSRSWAAGAAGGRCATRSTFIGAVLDVVDRSVTPLPPNLVGRARPVATHARAASGGRSEAVSPRSVPRDRAQPGKGRAGVRAPAKCRGPGDLTHDHGLPISASWPRHRRRSRTGHGRRRRRPARRDSAQTFRRRPPCRWQPEGSCSRSRCLCCRPDRAFSPSSMTSTGLDVHSP